MTVKAHTQQCLGRLELHHANVAKPLIKTTIILSTCEKCTHTTLSVCRLLESDQGDMPVKIEVPLTIFLH